jgi:cytochrome b
MTTSRQHPNEVCVWDTFVRIFHWSLVAAFTVAYLTEDPLIVHVWAGYIVGFLVLARVVWGFVGPAHARFSEFIYRPAAAFSYMRDLIAARAPRYLGHSPGGGAMVVALLVFLAATVATGLIVYGGEQQAGPLAGIVIEERGEELEEVHEVISNITLALIFLQHRRSGAGELCAPREFGARYDHRLQASLKRLQC